MPLTDDQRGPYVGQPGWNLLHLACWPLIDALGVPYLVGSAITKKNFRDVDVRVILPDDRFNQIFPTRTAPRRLDPLWALMCASISEHLIRNTGLPIDFQIQSATEARAYDGPREALGIFPQFAPAAARSFDAHESAEVMEAAIAWRNAIDGDADVRLIAAVDALTAPATPTEETLR